MHADRHAHAGASQFSASYCWTVAGVIDAKHLECTVCVQELRCDGLMIKIACRLLPRRKAFLMMLATALAEAIWSLVLECS